MKKRTYKLAVVALMGAVLGMVAAQAAPITYTFVNNGYFDSVGIDATGTEGGVTITTVDILGLDGSRASSGLPGTAHLTNIGGSGSLGINTDGSEASATNFEALEAWEFKFDTDVYLVDMDISGFETDSYFTLSSLSAEFADITMGDVNTNYSLGTVFVTAGTTLSLSFTPGTTGDSSRITTFTVDTIPEPGTLGLISACALGAFMIRRFRV